ncbi:MAG: acetyl-CoA carboxylase biotin carboxyl carrier protein [Candidatus Wallbacteria bacterium]|nr:acetyl-CoA carboxylase biotin carboxyl carrier protein [Candidatus Wallbacteria bacterium]
MVEETRELLKLAQEFGLEELDVEIDGLKFKATRSSPAAALASPPAAVAAPGQAAVPAPEQAAAPPPAQVKSNHVPIVSPMVGTFYRASAPDKSVYVKEGDVVGPETVVCIVEAMKLMNEIKAGVRGRIVACEAQNAEPVKAGQTLFLVDPA